jgi:hypothetical protein
LTCFLVKKKGAKNSKKHVFWRKTAFFTFFKSCLHDSKP